MNHQTLTDLLTSADDKDIQQAVAYFEQQKQIPQDLLTECFVAWQLVEDKKAKKYISKVLTNYTSNNFQLFLTNKYLLKKHTKAKKIQEIWEALASYQLIDTEKLAIYLFPFYPSLLWQPMQAIQDPKIKDSLFKHPKILTTTKLTIADLKLTEIPTEISFLKNLESLVLSHNNLSKADLALLTKLPKLKELDLSHCKLTQIPVVLHMLTNIEKLDLSVNPIINGTFDFLIHLGALQNFSIWQESFIVDKNISILQQLKTCKELKLWLCNLNQLPRLLTELPNLEKLDLYGNNLSKADFEEFTNLKQLKKIILHHCKLTKIPIQMNELVNLEVLDLGENNLSEANFSAFVDLKNLKEVNLWSCGIKELPATLISLLKKKIKIKLEIL